MFELTVNNIAFAWVIYFTGFAVGSIVTAGWL